MINGESKRLFLMWGKKDSERSIVTPRYFNSFVSLMFSFLILKIGGRIICFALLKEREKDFSGLIFIRFSYDQFWIWERAALPACSRSLCVVPFTINIKSSAYAIISQLSFKGRASNVSNNANQRKGPKQEP